MGLLPATRGLAVPVVDLRLASRTVPVNGRQGRMLEEQEAWSLGIERVRRNVQLMRSTYAADVTQQAIVTMGHLSGIAERVARQHPAAGEYIAMMLEAAGAGQFVFVQEAHR